MSFALVSRRSAAALRRGASMPNLTGAVRLESTAASGAASGATSGAASAAKSAASSASSSASAGGAQAAKAAKDAAATARDSAAKASAVAAEYSAKAAQGLSRVTASAGPVLSSAAKGVAGALGALSRIGGPAGRLFSFIERQIPLVTYYSKVGAEVGKLVFQGQKMGPPPLSTFQTFWQNVFNQLKNPSGVLRDVESPGAALQKLQGLSRAQWAAGGVLAAELLGFFTVGEIIGRFKLIGYRGASGAAHH